jgi:hypothetical protein
MRLKARLDLGQAERPQEGVRQKLAQGEARGPNAIEALPANSKELLSRFTVKKKEAVGRPRRSRFVSRALFHSRSLSLALRRAASLPLTLGRRVLMPCGMPPSCGQSVGSFAEQEIACALIGT